MIKSYQVNTTIKHDGEEYRPDTENDIIKLTEKQAAPLLATNAISELDEESLEVPAEQDVENATVQPEECTNIVLYMDLKEPQSLESIDRVAKHLTNMGFTVLEFPHEQAGVVGLEELVPIDDEVPGTETADAETTADETVSQELTEAERLQAIKRAIDGLDVSDPSKWTQNKKADRAVLSELVGFNVTAAERDAAALLPKTNL